MAAALIATSALAGCAVDEESSSEQHSAAQGVTPTLLSRGRYQPFTVESEGLVNFEAKAKTAVDVITRQHDYLPNSHTGWHTHPGPVFITVVSGTLTFYESDDPSCTPVVVTAGNGYVDHGHGHIARNETGAAARDITVILAPPGLPFRGEINPPGNCAF
ncbi:MAG: hypothetical protein H0T42_18290 [Deltaproteobacteria bacterium]|nr:hypothetical protein [Deltaproteobacteria bacterium]